MGHLFPEPIRNLPLADILIAGLKAYLSQADGHQIIFMEFSEPVEVPAHSHASQWGVVIEGKVELTIDGVERVYTKGEHYYIPEGVMHSAKIFPGYADVTFFNQPDRYKPVQE
ncbi:MAG: cupin domain-containing protein [Chloroflexi bacterium]|nr:cupin domain-containing protein [Chloroflexota bacterium]